jgi:hypothetical protein
MITDDGTVCVSGSLVWGPLLPCTQYNLRTSLLSRFFQSEGPIGLIKFPEIATNLTGFRSRFQGIFAIFRRISRFCHRRDNHSGFAHWRAKKQTGKSVFADFADTKISYEAGSSHFVANLETLIHALATGLGIVIAL